MKLIFSILSALSMFSYLTSFGQFSNDTNVEPGNEESTIQIGNNNTWTNFSVFEMGKIYYGSSDAFYLGLLKYNKGICNNKLGLGTIIFEMNNFKISETESLKRSYLLPVEMTIPLYLQWKTKNDEKLISNFGIQLKIWQSTFSQVAKESKDEHTGLVNTVPPILQNNWFKETRVSISGYYYFLTIEIGWDFNYAKEEQFDFNNQAFIKATAGIPGSMKYRKNSSKSKISVEREGSYSFEDYEMVKSKEEEPQFKISNSNKIINTTDIKRSSIDDPNKSTSNKSSIDVYPSFISPIDKELFKISSAFGNREHPYWGKELFHNGVDLSCSLRTPVVAVLDGIAIETGFNNSYGNYIILKHNDGYKTIYAHLHRILIYNGDQVNQGQIIGTVGNTGISTGPHLHYEIIHYDKNIDPIKFVK